MKSKITHPFIVWVFILTTCFLFIIFLCRQAEGNCHYVPDYQKSDITQILAKDSLSKEDYSLLFYQTGLAPAAVDTILATDTDPSQRLLDFQENFFAPVQIDCEPNTIVSKEESITNKKIILAPYENADILITNASHVLFYRNGHAGLILDTKKGQTLEAAVMGSDSSIQNIKKWRSYPNFVVLRLKNETCALSKQVCETAEEKLCGIPYRLTSGLFTSKPCDASPVTGTQCAHLVWSAYYLNGIDLDSDGGRIVTPYDILKSSSLELIQVYGLDPSDFINSLFPSPSA